MSSGSGGYVPAVNKLIHRPAFMDESRRAHSLPHGLTGGAGDQGDIKTSPSEPIPHDREGWRSDPPDSMPRQGDGAPAGSVEAASITSKFQTARGGRVSFSKEALGKAADLFGESASAAVTASVPATAEAAPFKTPSHGTAIAASTGPALSSDPSAPAPARSASMFQTAKGKSVTVSADAMRKASCLFSADTPIASVDARAMVPTAAAPSASNDSIAIDSKSTVSASRVSAFQTARGGRVTVSDAAVQRAAGMLGKQGAPDPLAASTSVSTAFAAPSYTTPGCADAYPRATDADTNEYEDSMPASKYARVTPFETPTESVASLRRQWTEETSAEESTRVVECEGVASGDDVVAPVAGAEAGAEAAGGLDEALPPASPVDAEEDAELRMDVGYLLAHCPCALVSPADVEQARLERRLRLLRGITSETAALVVFDDLGDFSFAPGGMIDDLLSRLSASALSPELQRWVASQLRWVVWTLASYERRFPSDRLGNLLHLSNVLTAVSSRYSAYICDGSIAPASDLALRRFKSKSSMSPLERCCDIITLVWPLVVCLAIDSTGACRITDGWWWTSSALDSSLRELVVRKRLSDGCKLVVLSATFESDSAGCTVQLKINCVRKARNSAKLGFVRPAYLRRGLALSSLVADGGPVFAINARVVHVCPLLSKLKFDLDVSSSSALPSPARWIPLDSIEMGVFRHAVSRARDVVENGIEDHEELALPYLLDDIDCDSCIAAIILGSEKGQDVDVTESQRNEVMRVMNKLREMRQRAAARLVAEDVRIPHFAEQSYIDVLVSCSYSCRECWLRFPGSSGGESGPRFAAGDTLTATNLKCVRAMGTSLLLQATPNTSITRSARHPSLAAVSSSALANIRAARVCECNAEVTIECYVVDWHTTDETSSTLSYNIVLTDHTRACLVLKYTIPLQLQSNIAWLRKHAHIRIHFASVQHYDYSNDILLCSRSDHTYITTETHPGAEKCKAFMDTVTEEESRRYNAICTGKALFVSCYRHVAESCSRDHFPRLSLKLTTSSRSDVSRLYSFSNPDFIFYVRNSLLDLYFPAVDKNDLLICNISASRQYAVSEAKKEVKFSFWIVWIEPIQPVEEARHVLASIA